VQKRHGMKFVLNRRVKGRNLELKEERKASNSKEQKGETE